MKDEERRTITNALRGIPSHFKLLARSLSALVMFIIGFNFSRTQFFEQYPLFNVRYLAELLLSFLMALVGFYIIPKLLMAFMCWLENMIYSAISEIVNNFWEQQSQKMQDAREERQKQRSQEVKDKIKEEFSHAIVLDTSVLVDGRIVDMAKTGFLDNVFIVPHYVLGELHLLSDSKDDLKRKKGRRGLDILRKLKKLSKVYIPEGSDQKVEVDKELIRLAKSHELRLMTMDFNLNKLASVSGVTVLNINDLTNAIKTVLIPGETIVIKIIHEGKERKQGIGYLEDGTMIVVEDTKDKVGEEINAKVAKVIQSSAGKIIFCELA